MAVNESSTQLRAQPRQQAKVATGEITSTQKVITQVLAVLITTVIVSSVAYGLNMLMTMGQV